MVGRRTDPETGKIYHLKYSPPPADVPLERLVHRSDDTEDKIQVRHPPSKGDKTKPLFSHPPTHPPTLPIGPSKGLSRARQVCGGCLQERSPGGRRHSAQRQGLLLHHPTPGHHPLQKQEEEDRRRWVEGAEEAPFHHPLPSRLYRAGCPPPPSLPPAPPHRHLPFLPGRHAPPPPLPPPLPFPPHLQR